MNFPFDIQNYKELVDNSELGPGGYYPIGTGNIWHSGVHINYKGGDRIIRPIIPGGRVVAFRLNDEYQECGLPENITQDSFLHEFAHYKDKYAEIQDGDYSYYELDKTLEDKTYTVSNNFILLKHEIESKYLSKKLVFYSLYMNLAPITDKTAETRTVHTNQKPFYPDFMLDNSTKKVKSGFNTVDYEKSQGLSEIGKPGFLKGSWYFDFCVFFENSLFNFKGKIFGEKKLLFHHFDENITLYTRSTKREVTSRKFYWPNGTEAEKISYTDEGKTVFQYKITKIRPIVEVSSAKENVDYKIEGEKITILKTDNLWLSGKKVSELSDFRLKNIENKAFNFFYIDGNGRIRKPAFYVSSEYFEAISFWTTNGNLSGTTECEVYDANPLVYDYEVFTPEETFYKSIIDIDTQEFETNNLNSPVVKVETDSDRGLYIKVSDKNKCYRSAFNWTDWFYNLNALETHKDDIICDRTSVIEKLIECFNEQIKSLGSSRVVLEKWWYGSQIVDEYLKGIFGSNEKYEFTKKMRDQFQKAVCRHPLEWDKTLFNCKKIEDSYFDITHTHLREHIKTKLIKESEQSDIWEGALQNLFKKNDFYFVNPLYFAYHLDRAEVFGFNPYEGKTYKEIFKLETVNNIVGNNITENGESKVVSNPGFAPVYDSTFPGRNPNINGYACVTGFFNQDYLDVTRGNGEKYRKIYEVFTHEGVDFRGKEGTEIKSFIYGTVLAYGTFGNYGRTIFIRNSESTGIYLLAHLQGYNSPVLDKGVITPGTLVGYVGTSGPEKDGTIDGKYDAHLHVTYFSLAQSEYIKQFITGINGKNLYTDINYKNGSVRNPFNIESRKTKNKPK